MKEKILFAVTSHDKLGDTGQPTGYWLSEVTHPWSVLAPAFDIDVVSPQGGRPPVTGLDLTDSISAQLWDNPQWQDKMSATMTPDQVDPHDYRAIFFAGGHGAMWDFPDNKRLQQIAADIYENGGFVAAVCHGPAGLVNIRLSNGSYLISGKHLDSFTNEEEQLNGTATVVPFMLQTMLESRGCIYDTMAPWTDHVVVDGHLITGQNPQSALSLGKTLLSALTENK